MKIVTVGGGTGSAVLLSGLKPHPHQITAIVSMFDSGGSTGILRTEFGYPPFGDIRQCLLALAPDNERSAALRTAFDFRFNSGSSLGGHSVGNLVLAALTSALENGVEGAIAEMGRLLGIDGRVVPVTMEDAQLCAELMDGQIVWTESAIDLRGEETPPIKRVFLNRPVRANPVAVEAIADADIVVLGPGDLYTSVVPNLLAEGIGEALAATGASLIYVCNVMTKLGETSGYRASEFAAAVHQYLHGRDLDGVVVNTEQIPAEVLASYQKEGAEAVELDTESVLKFASRVFDEPLLSLGPPVRHDEKKLADLIVRVGSAPRAAARGGRSG